MRCTPTSAVMVLRISRRMPLALRVRAIVVQRGDVRKDGRRNGGPDRSHDRAARAIGEDETLEE